MAVQGNWTEIMDEIFCSDQAAANQSNLSELIVTRLYSRVDLNELFTLVAPVRTGDAQVGLIYPAVYNAIKNTEGTDCDISECDVSPEWTARKWAIVIAECRHGLCTREMPSRFLAYWGMYKRVDPESTEYEALVDQVVDMLSGLMANTLLAKLWLSDTTFQADPGVIDDFLDGIDGFLAQMMPVTDQVVDMGDTPLTDGEAIYNKIAEGIQRYKRSDFRDTFSNARLYIEEQDADSIVAWLNTLDKASQYNCQCVDPNGIIRGDRFEVEGLMIGGLRVYTQPFEKMMSQFDEYSTGGTPNMHNIFVIAPKEVMLAGSGNQDDFNVQKVFYDDYRRKYFFDIGYSYGALIPQDFFILGYGEKDNG